MDKRVIGFGIAGNFTHHLEQAGESEDFIDVEVDEESAPKGIFPTYIPWSETFLGIYPFSEDKISLMDKDNIQMEPEVALICEIDYNKNKIANITPTHFMAYNDCSIRAKGAKKISYKKNWGLNSKGVSGSRLKIGNFSLGCVTDDYSLTSFIKRDNRVIQYGENSALLDYSYFYEKLISWIVDKLNNQHDHGPLEDLNTLILEARKPEKMIISIGASRYTEFGESNYLKSGDIIYVIVYNHKRYEHSSIIEMVKRDEFASGQISVLRQEVI